MKNKRKCDGQNAHILILNLLQAYIYYNHQLIGYIQFIISINKY